MVEPLTKTKGDGRVYARLPEIETEISCALELGLDDILAQVAITNPRTDGYMSSECMVYLIRQDVKSSARKLVNELTPLLLKRCESNLLRKVTGFREPTLQEVHEEILGRLVELLVDGGNRADYFEVRFNHAFKCLRCEVCTYYQRHDDASGSIEDKADSSGDNDGGGIDDLHDEIDYDKTPSSLSQDDSVYFSQVLSNLTDIERNIFILHKQGGIPINSKFPGVINLVNLLEISERTVRNYLRNAEAKLAIFKEAGNE